MEDKKQIAINDLKRALRALGIAWKDTNEAWSNIYLESDDCLWDDYPFEQSFDEIMFEEWIDSCLNNLKKEVK